MLRTIALAASVLISALFVFFFYDHYLSRLDCFNELGRCFDEQTGVVYLKQSGIAWFGLAALSVGLTLYQLRRW